MLNPYSQHALLESGLNIYDVMPFHMKALCIAIFAPSVPVLRLYPDHIVRVNDPDLFSKVHCSCFRFLLMWKDKHVVCCRMEDGRTGLQCILMDTCSTECPNSSNDLIDFIRCSEKLPMHIRNANLDIFCNQQPEKGGGCTVMSLVNVLYKKQRESSSAFEGERLRMAFCARYLDMNLESRQRCVDRWSDSFTEI